MTIGRIFSLDGPALTRLAWELQLGHEGLRQTFDPEMLWSCMRELPGVETAMWVPWEPHTNLAQADAVFRGLRACRWATTQEYFFSTGTGVVEAWKDGTHVRRSWGEQRQELTEVLALLRVSVLAIASIQESPHAKP